MVGVETVGDMGFFGTVTGDGGRIRTPPAGASNPAVFLLISSLLTISV